MSVCNYIFVYVYVCVIYYVWISIAMIEIQTHKNTQETNQALNWIHQSHYPFSPLPVDIVPDPAMFLFYVPRKEIILQSYISIVMWRSKVDFSFMCVAIERKRTR